MRTLTAASQGKVPGPEGSIGKLFGGRVLTELGELAIDLVGAGAIARADDDYRWHQPLLGAPAAHIAGGSDEVMKNIIGERVLGLPGEPRVDKGVALARRPALTPTGVTGRCGARAPVRFWLRLRLDGRRRAPRRRRRPATFSRRGPRRRRCRCRACA